MRWLNFSSKRISQVASTPSASNVRNFCDKDWMEGGTRSGATTALG